MASISKGCRGLGPVVRVSGGRPAGGRLGPTGLPAAVMAVTADGGRQRADGMAKGGWLMADGARRTDGGRRSAELTVPAL